MPDHSPYAICRSRLLALAGQAAAGATPTIDQLARALEPLCGAGVDAGQLRLWVVLAGRAAGAAAQASKAGPLAGRVAAARKGPSQPAGTVFKQPDSRQASPAGKVPVSGVEDLADMMQDGRPAGSEHYRHYCLAEVPEKMERPAAVVREDLKRLVASAKTPEGKIAAYQTLVFDTIMGCCGM